VPGVATAALLTAAASVAHADPCTALGAHVVYVAGSSAVKPFLGKVAAALATQSPPIFVVYVSEGSCAGVGHMSVPDSDPGALVTASVPAVTFDSTGAPTANGCDLDPSGALVDIGAADVYAATCGKTVDTGVVDNHGPIQTMTFTVPKDSTATSISAEAAYLVYGFGAASNAIAPWNDPTVIFQRNGGSGTQNMIATAINVPAAKWQPAANTNPSSDNMLTALTTAAGNGKAQNAIGILATDFTDKHRDVVKVLAYQHYGQSCGWLPDSTAQAFDKKNVRDGHYQIWGPLHLYTRGNASDDAKKVIGYLSLTDTTQDLGALIATEAKAGVIPDCAMQVSRTAEVGALASYEPAHPCGCKFEAEATGTTPAGCTPCTPGGNECASVSGKPACNYGFCEAQ
jgi:ABC-type phosphate transport system substrate-binding protein